MQKREGIAYIYVLYVFVHSSLKIRIIMVGLHKKYSPIVLSSCTFISFVYHLSWQSIIIMMIMWVLFYVKYAAIIYTRIYATRRYKIKKKKNSFHLLFKVIINFYFFRSVRVYFFFFLFFLLNK